MSCVPVGRAAAFRLAQTTDFPAVNRLAAQVHALHAEARPDVFSPSDAPYDAEGFASLLSDPMSSVYVAERDGAVVGYAVLAYYGTRRLAVLRPRQLCSVEDFCVDAAVRRQGIGSAFFAFLRRTAARRGAQSLELTVWEFNRQAQAFYEAQGLRCRARKLELALR